MNNVCAFCDPDVLSRQAIRTNSLCISLVSKYWFREGHCLVVPKRHIVTIADLTPQESSAIMSEIGRLCTVLNDGYGTGVMQKFQPLQPENGIKVNHLHFHVFPRLKNDEVLFPVPIPNSFAGLKKPSGEAFDELLQRLR